MRLGKKSFEPSAAQKIGHAQERLHVMSALAVVLDRPDDLLRVLNSSRGPDEARAHLQAVFGLDELQSNAVLDMQFRNATSIGVERIRDEVSQLEEEIRALQEQRQGESG